MEKGLAFAGLFVWSIFSQPNYGPAVMEIGLRLVGFRPVLRGECENLGQS